MNMKCFVRHNVRKHSEINNDENYITLEVSLNKGILGKIRKGVDHFYGSQDHNEVKED